MKKRKTGKERVMYAFGTGIGEDTRIKPLNTEAIKSANIAPNLLYRSVAPAVGLMAPTETQEGFSEYNQTLFNRYAGYPEAVQKGVSNTFKAYNDGGVYGNDNPSTLDQILNNVEYMKRNMPSSNIYRDKNSHYSIDGYDTKAKDTPMVAALGTGKDGVGGYGDLLKQIPGVADTIMGLFENNDYSSQPIVNASTIRGMKTPYSFALGGEVEDEDQLQKLQEMADEQGISIEELIMQLQDAQNPDSMDARDEEDLYEEEPEEEEPEEVDEIGETFGGEFAYGGTAGKVPIEVEGGEVLENPQGKVKKAVGPSHAGGGIDVNVAPGTKVYSDRIQIDGKTMAERKLKREKAEKRLEKLKLKHEYDPLVNNSLQRTMQVNQAEEAEDMQLQEVLKGIEDKKKYPNGGIVPWGGTPYPYNQPERPFDPLAGTGLTDYIPERVPMARPALLSYTKPAAASAKIKTPVLGNGVGSPASQALPHVGTEDGNAFTLGDGVGMAGNLFNAIAPFVNTRNAAAATKPTVNRFRGFGKDAIFANDQAQIMANTVGKEALTDIDTSANSAIERGRNSASSISTARAMDIATVIGANKAKTGARDATTRQLIGLTGQRGQLTNQRDQMEMSGQERADIANEQKTDNYFSNNAANLVNFGSNIQGLGRNLNTSKQNQVDANLIASMTKSDIKVGANGKIVNKYKTPKEVQSLLDMGFTIDENGKLVRPRKRG